MRTKRSARLSSEGLRLSLVGVRTNRICEDQEISLAVLISMAEAVLSRCRDEQNLTGPGTELMRTKKSGSLAGSPQKGGCCTFFEDVAK